LGLAGPGLGRGWAGPGVQSAFALYRLYKASTRQLQMPANVFHFVVVFLQIQLRGYLEVIQRLIKGYSKGYLEVNSIFTRLWENCFVEKEFISFLLNKQTFKHLL